MPLGIAMLATVLEDAGFEVRLFDTTLYSDPTTDNQAEREMTGQIKGCDYSTVGVFPKLCDMGQEFIDMVNEFDPGLIGVSCVESTYRMAEGLLNSVKDSRIPTIMGGVFASFSPEIPLCAGVVDMVCVGEGEEAMVEVARQVAKGERAPRIPNIWTRDGARPIPPPEHRLCDLQNLPIPRFDVFDSKRIYRSMSGVLYRMLPLEISRGCPYHCTYCSAPSYQRLFSRQGKWLRFKPVSRLIEEAKAYIKHYDVEYLYLVSETFLAMPEADRKDFYKQYARLGVPFWFNTRPETVTEKDMLELAAVGCHRVSIGLESGNEVFRKTVLRRNYSNETVLRAVEWTQNAGIQLSVNNMLGFPDETREFVFDTIRLNRQFTCDNHSLSIFHPFRGTALHESCVAKGYWDPDTICDGSFSEPRLRMPTLTTEEVKGLYRTFNLYRSLDESHWGEIRKAERMTPEGDAAFERLWAQANAAQPSSTSSAAPRSQG